MLLQLIKAWTPGRVALQYHSRRCALNGEWVCYDVQARARDLFYGLWTTDVFMQRVEANADWSLFCPNEAPGLADCWGEEHAALYTRYEREGRAKRTIKAQQLWFAILEAQASFHCRIKRLKASIVLCCAHVLSHAVLV